MSKMVKNDAANSTHMTTEKQAVQGCFNDVDFDPRYRRLSGVSLDGLSGLADGKIFWSFQWVAGA